MQQNLWVPSVARLSMADRNGRVTFDLLTSPPSDSTKHTWPAAVAGLPGWEIKQCFVKTSHGWSDFGTPTNG